ncbi:MAG: DUF4878 domain-containing protein [Actinobacteria bacterium]|nr:DUF4878 domain-containing protein [Actinomycetota bacterium]
MRKIIIVTCIVSMIFGGVAVIGCGGGGGGKGDSPKQVAQKFMEGLADNDVDGYLALVTEGSKKGVDVEDMKKQTAEYEKQQTEKIEFKVGEEKIDGDKALVDVTVIQQGMEMTMKWTLLKENGVWRVDLTTEPIMEGTEGIEPDQETTPGTLPETEPAE